jgi:hypothetical protein
VSNDRFRVDTLHIQSAVSRAMSTEGTPWSGRDDHFDMIASGQLFQVLNDLFVIALRRDFVNAINEQTQPSLACVDNGSETVLQLVH